MDTLLSLMGTFGVAAVLLAYFLLLTLRLRATDRHYILLNLLGMTGILAALNTGHAVPLMLALLGWLGLSLFALYRHHIATE